MMKIAEEKRNELTFEAIKAAPEVLKAVIKVALSGDLEAAALVFKIANVDLSASANKGPANAVQINITAQEQAQLEEDFRSGRTICYDNED